MVRHLVQKDGAMVLERLDQLDDPSRTLQYHIVESDLPFSAYKSTIQVKAREDGTCQIIWTSTFERKSGGADADQILTMLKKNYRRYLERLNALCIG